MKAKTSPQIDFRAELGCPNFISDQSVSTFCSSRLVTTFIPIQPTSTFDEERLVMPICLCQSLTTFSSRRLVTNFIQGQSISTSDTRQHILIFGMDRLVSTYDSLDIWSNPSRPSTKPGLSACAGLSRPSTQASSCLASVQVDLSLPSARLTHLNLQFGQTCLNLRLRSTYFDLQPVLDILTFGLTHSILTFNPTYFVLTTNPILPISTFDLTRLLDLRPRLTYLILRPSRPVPIFGSALPSSTLEWVDPLDLRP